MSDVVTRFAPSPTGFLHIGGVRTALFNFLFARHHEGKFLLRIEDTDQERTSKAAIDAIIEGLKWLHITWDGVPTFQSSTIQRHRDVAHALLRSGKAYYCFATPEELENMRLQAKARGEPMRYDGTWRDRDPKEAPPGVKPVIRFRAPVEGETHVYDKVVGNVVFQNKQLDDLILLRSDLTPTYNLCCIVDDHDMGITHVIRGDDHLNNAARQTQIYDALGWTPPIFAHIPLIFGQDGTKLSKRHGAIGVNAYYDMGYIPEALRNYLVRLGWSHNDEEIFSYDDMIRLFSLEAINRSPARFDFAKLEFLNGHYMKTLPQDLLMDYFFKFLEDTEGWEVDLLFEQRVRLIFPSMRERAKTMLELVNGVEFLYKKTPPTLSEDARTILTEHVKEQLREVLSMLKSQPLWDRSSLESAVRLFTEKIGVPLKDIAQPLRAALTGKLVSPPVFDVMNALGSEETLSRIESVL